MRSYLEQGGGGLHGSVYITNIGVAQHLSLLRDNFLHSISPVELMYAIIFCVTTKSIIISSASYYGENFVQFQFWFDNIKLIKAVNGFVCHI